LTFAKDESDFRKKMIQCIRSLQKDGYETIAVICKTAKESKQAFENLKTELPVRLITAETYSFERGILIIPAYLAKGIEFDAVIIYNASHEQYFRKLEQKLFYTACTRAMHELRLFTLGEKTPFLDRVPDRLYIQNGR
jgi:DNA helicase-2/ATP-dependent DNA helicase PcrA